MDDYPKDRSLNWLDRETQQRLCRQGREVLQRAQRRAKVYMWIARKEFFCSRCLQTLTPHLESPIFRKRKPINLNTSFNTMMEYMDYVSSQCGRFHSVPEKAAMNHVCRYHQNHVDPMSSSWVRRVSHRPGRESVILIKGPQSSNPVISIFSFQAGTSSKDITIEVCPGTYTVTVGSPNVTTTHMIEVDSGEIIDLSFPL
uniref:A-kinase interacting protein 1 n=1 Tax=Vombatus ursinus TaxID=29139 RepID=A0A4X2K3R4_VOMUR